MKKIYLLSLLSGIIFSLNAQDEGVIIRKERLEFNQGVFIGGGPSFTLGKNIGDYSTGLNFEIGYTNRLNRILSLGGSISYTSFKYDSKKTGENNIFIGDEYFDSQEYLNYLLAMYVDFDGGDLNLTSAAFNIKLNLIPVTDASMFSVYVFAKPFVTMYTRTEVKGTALLFGVYDLDSDGTYTAEEAEYSAQYAVENASFDNPRIPLYIPWQAGDPTLQDYGVTLSDDLKKESKVTGGIVVGPGIEFMPARKISIYAQAGFGYTFPVTFISTEKYKGNDLNTVDEKYPVAKEGFPSINVQAGLTFNF